MPNGYSISYEKSGRERALAAWFRLFCTHRLRSSLSVGRVNAFLRNEISALRSGFAVPPVEMTPTAPRKDFS